MYHLSTIIRDIVSTQRRYNDIHNNFIETSLAYTNNIDHYLRMYDRSYDIYAITNRG